MGSPPAAAVDDEMEEALGLREVLEAVETEIIQLDAVESVTRGRAEQDLAAMAGRHHARQPVYLDAQVAGRAALEPPAVDTHPRPNRVVAQRPLGRHGRAHRA